MGPAPTALPRLSALAPGPGTAPYPSFAPTTHQRYHSDNSLSPTSSSLSPSMSSASAMSTSASTSVSTLVHTSPPRPKSSSALPTRPAPYMVALSGWPEPIYIDSSRGSRRSRETTPRQSFSFGGEVRDGIDLEMSMGVTRGGSPVDRRMGTGGAMGGGAWLSSSSGKGGVGLGTGTGTSGIAASYGDRFAMDPTTRRAGEIAMAPGYRGSSRSTPLGERDTFPYPTSSARSSARSSFSGPAGSGAPPPLAAPPPPPHPPPAAASSSLSRPVNPSTTPAARRSTFFDPRLAPNAAVLQNRGALQVAPAWVGPSSPPSSSSHTGAGGALHPSQASSSHPVPTPAMATGVKVTAGQRGTGFLVMRAVPDVYPPYPYAHVGNEAGSPSSAMSPSSSSPGTGGLGGLGTLGSLGAGGFAGQMSRVANVGAGGVVGMATEVYPRDPETGFLWGGGAGVGGVATSTSGMERGGSGSGGARVKRSPASRSASASGASGKTTPERMDLDG